MLTLAELPSVAISSILLLSSTSLSLVDGSTVSHHRHIVKTLSQHHLGAVIDVLAQVQVIVRQNRSTLREVFHYKIVLWGD